MNQYEEPSTPELDDLQQNNEREALITVPVRIVEQGPVHTHHLPARDAVMRTIVVPPDSSVIQIVGRDLRRSRLLTWVRGEANGDFIYMGVDKNEVESNNAAQIYSSVPEALSPNTVEHWHCMPVWVKNTGVNQQLVSFLAEYYAD